MYENAFPTHGGMCPPMSCTVGLVVAARFLETVLTCRNDINGIKSWWNSVKPWLPSPSPPPHAGASRENILFLLSLWSFYTSSPNRLVRVAEVEGDVPEVLAFIGIGEHQHRGRLGLATPEASSASSSTTSASSGSTSSRLRAGRTGPPGWPAAGGPCACETLQRGRRQRWRLSCFCKLVTPISFLLDLDRLSGTNESG